MQCPIISLTQKIVIYETKARFYVVGSNNTETRFRVLKIDRTELHELHIVDDKVEYSRKQIRDLLLMIDLGNRPKQQQKYAAGLSKSVSAFGIVGFVRFMEGYYIILITKRKRVALIGSHFIYKIEDTSMIYIPNDTESRRYQHPDEQRYLKMFQNVDLSSNFYFSYSYDLTHTLQYNLTPCKAVNSDPTPLSPESVLRFWKTEKLDCHVHKPTRNTHGTEDATSSVNNFLETSATPSPEPADSSDGSPQDTTQTDREEAQKTDPDLVYGVRMEPTWKYVWNLHLLKPVQDQLHPDWILYITHGFIGQSNMQVFGRPVFLTLISRRSSQFAGTRFLKRGANDQGAVANEVETEQIVHNVVTSDFHQGGVTSTVQLRGSIPLYWSQDISKMVPKPSILIDQVDPFGSIAGQHFNQVLRRCGAPVIILNLVKKREKKKHEGILSEELVKSLKYLNQFLPPEHAIQYIGFDMARFNKSKNMKNENVLQKLAEIAEYCVKKTGFFHMGRDLHCNSARPHPRCKGMRKVTSDIGRKQVGVVRTNCVDCLDRTNTAQFAIGKCALAFQLHALGIIDQPGLMFDTDCYRMLEDLYEDQGDTLAVQYGGSQLVHRIKDYRKLAPWTSSSRDLMQTLSRYYSNAFSDSDKQQAINLFLGVYQPKKHVPAIWDLVTDFYLHNRMTLLQPSPTQRSYTQWWDSEVFSALPLACEEEGKGLEQTPLVIRTNRADERVSSFWEYYKPFELTSLDELYSFSMPNSMREFMPKFAKSYSPFAQRVRPMRRQEELGSSMTEANPNVSGKESTASTASTGSEDSTSSSGGSDIEGDIEVLDDHNLHKEESGLSLFSLKDLFPTMAETYGMDIKSPSKNSITAYRKFVDIGRKASQPVEIERGVRKAGPSTELVQSSIFPLDNSHSVEPPILSQVSRDIYETYVHRGKTGAQIPSKSSLLAYQSYAMQKYL